MALLPISGSKSALHNKLHTFIDKKLVNDKDIYGNTPLHAVATNTESHAAQMYDRDAAKKKKICSNVLK